MNIRKDREEHKFSQIDCLWAPSMLGLVFPALCPALGRSDCGKQRGSAGGLVPKSCLPLVTHGLGPTKAPLSMEFFKQEY